MYLKYDMKIVFYKTYKIKSVSCKNCMNTFHVTERKILFTDAIM